MRIVLAYSGSRDGSAAIVWLRERRNAEVVTVTLDLGQGGVLEAIRDRAVALGAQRAHVLDARELFAHEIVVPALRADAVHEGGLPMARALSRPVIARRVADLADIERADAVAHTSRTSGGSSTLDRLLRQLRPALPVLAPVREWTLSDDDLGAFARRHGLDPGGDPGSRVDTNFWGRTVLPDEGAFGPLPARAAHCADEPAIVDIAFTEGVPRALNGIALPVLELASSLGTLAAIHGVGYRSGASMACEAPAAVLLHQAHRDLTRAASSTELQAFSREARRAYVRAVETGNWFSPLREALDAYFAAAQSHVAGEVRLRLHNAEHVTISTHVSRGPVDAAPRPGASSTPR
jgi:argininosuccinate synthase